MTETHWAVSNDHPPTNFEKVQEFHKAIGIPSPDGLVDPGPLRVELREKLREEYAELLEAMFVGDIESIAKELADLLYVIYGTADEYGIPMDTVFAQVHTSNMSKLVDGAIRHDGKVFKGPNYKPVDLSWLKKSV